jgi:hypothetical protein
VIYRYKRSTHDHAGLARKAGSKLPPTTDHSGKANMFTITPPLASFISWTKNFSWAYIENQHHHAYALYQS